MTVATRFPIPHRPNEEQGLQIPIEIMATLGHVLVADDFGSGIVLKGDVFDFFPTARNGNYVQWHLVDSAKNALQEYEHPTGSSRLGQNKLSREALSTTTAFLAWTPHITNNSGKPCFNYKICIISALKLDQEQRKLIIRKLSGLARPKHPKRQQNLRDSHLI